MDFVVFRDDGSAPEIFAIGQARISRIGDVVRITYYSEREAPDGAIDRHAVAHIVMGWGAWTDTQLLSMKATEIIKASPRDGWRSGGDHQN